MKLSLSFVTFSLAGLALATPAKRAPALTVDVSAPTSVSSVDDVKITAKVTNTGPEAVKILKYGTVLDASLPTRSFVVSKNGMDTAFTGVKIQLDMDALKNDAFVTIPAGQTVTVVHDIAALYDFESAGPGTFTFEPVSTFQIMDTKTPSQIQVPPKKIDVNIHSDVAKRELKSNNKRGVLQCSNTSQGSFISSSYSEAKTLASIASSYVSSRGSGDSLYRSYFGTTSTSTVVGVFNRVASESGNRSFNCADPFNVCGNGVIAYTVTSTTNIYYCSIFYNEVTTSRLCSGTSVASRNIRGGTTLHEITHATSGTSDIGYGCSFDQSLGSSSPSQASRNADNYNCFATQVYANTQC